MTSREDLKWNDLVSPTMTPDDYLNKFGEKIEYNYKTYEPKQEIIEKINKTLKEKNEKLRIVAFGADWCPDCSKNIPRMIKIVKLNKNKNIDYHILYDIMVNALHKPGEPIWHKKRSPPEAVDPKFDLKKIPTFYFFNKNGDYLGEIIENPKYESTIEEDMFEIIQESL